MTLNSNPLEEHKSWTQEKVKQFIEDMEDLVEYRYAPFAKRVAKLIKEMNFNFPITLIDLGCGPGFLLFELKNLLPNVRLIGIDASEIMLNAAKDLMRKRNVKNIEFKKSFAENLPFPEESVDVIVSQNSLHDFKNVKNSLIQVFRVLSTDRIFIDKSRNGSYSKWKRSIKYVEIAIRFGIREAKMVFKGANKWLNPKDNIHMMEDIGFEVNLLENKFEYLIFGKKK
ncbi:MAG: class I SAM-dependent methyltransferase [Candidatus Hermodarchaeota archaeon]